MTEGLSVDEVAKLVKPILDEYQAPCATIAVMLDGEMLLKAGIGARDLDNDEPLQADTPFLIYSITKTLLSVATMRLVERDVLALDTPVADLFQEMSLDGRITLRHLLNHTSGLPDYYGGMAAYHDAVRQFPDRPWPDDEFLKRTLYKGMLFAPGEGWAYSNIGYLLVRRLVSREFGDSLECALNALVFRDLQLTQTRVAATLDDTGDLAPGFTRAIGDGDLVDIRGRYHPGWVSHGVVRSTPGEVAQLVDALFAGKLVTSDSLAAMHEVVPVPVEHPIIRAPGYGLGLMIDRDPRSGGFAGHAGAGPGYSTAAFSLEGADGRRVTTAVFANRDVDDLGLRIVFAVGNEVIREEK